MEDNFASSILSMDLNEYLSNKQELQDAILKYIDQEKNEEENYQNIVQ